MSTGTATGCGEEPLGGDAAKAGGGGAEAGRGGCGRGGGSGEGAGGGGPEEPPAQKRRRVAKNPEVPTEFLPDAERERELERRAEDLRLQFLQREEEMRARPLLITFSYWNGSGNRRQVEVKQGDSIEQFLRQVREKLCDEFREVRACAVADLMYIKEDLILPLNLTFHELIVTRARGKSGPLFHFDVHDDVRLRMDARVEKDESHAGKVVERRWYSRHKHIFPYSRWELYDPEKTFERYTVRDSNKTD